MWFILSVILPIFALILAGWGARKINVLGPHAMSEINRFVIHLALPALLFDVVANADWKTLWQPTFIFAFSLGTFIVFIIALVLSRFQVKHLSDAAIDGLNASYSNTGFMGIPLALAVLGQSSLIPTMIATIITVCVLFAIVIVIVEVSLQSQGHPMQMMIKVLTQLAKNPLLVAPVLGALFMLFNIPVPAPAESFLKLLGAAASPCALVALGLFLAQPKSNTKSSLKGFGTLVILKLIVHPLIVWILATQVFDLSGGLLHCAVLLAALPTGTGPFMVTQYYQREGKMTSTVILLSTVFSLLTITVVLTLLHI